jgi:hypothetical protein
LNTSRSIVRATMPRMIKTPYKTALGWSGMRRLLGLRLQA